MDADRTASEADVGHEFEIGVCDASFRVYARIVMRGADGVRRLESDLSEMGYDAVTIGTSAQLQGCDMLVVRRPLQPSLMAA